LDGRMLPKDAQVKETIHVDSRVGSSHFLKLLRSIGCPTEGCQLRFGDVSWTGKGVEGEPVPCGCEIKRVGDLLTCICDHRLAGHQLPGLRRDYEHVWVIVEGVWRQGAEGLIEEYRKGKWWTSRSPVTYRGALNYLTSLEVLGGVYVRFSDTPMDTALMIASLYQWWQKPSHRSLFEFDESRELRSRRGVDLVPAGLVERVAKEFPGIGEKKARMAKGKWNTVWSMANASEADLAKVFGLSKAGGEKLWGALRTRGIK
jgi:ERCC4-type nuclease